MGILGGDRGVRDQKGQFDPLIMCELKQERRIGVDLPALILKIRQELLAEFSEVGRLALMAAQKISDQGLPRRVAERGLENRKS